MKIQTPYIIAGGAALALLAYVATRGATKTGEQIGGAAVDLATGVLSGTVQGTGTLFGIPQTNTTACARAKAEGRTWDASFDCPAKDFLSYLFN